ncbi:MAG: hypothetical protein DMF76_25785 [Acidobacteria bacterium]|nr:MAG: hypothetical protein DMF76_25785 [Acidobacteriota bacterium]
MANHPIFTGRRIWCPRCKDHVEFLRIEAAARLADVSPRTIRRYIADGRVYAFKVAGAGRYRVCSRCLFRPAAGNKDKKLDTS